ncbi:hypothetical protein [Lewinella sp. W8]|uniref:hypothetical protein n=1 Tax=Lewinella sp. W8 TaxID=2528208 RepID=UPI00106897CE|nr:hypothetical protein [Lewinella sp. W8]MTB53147.1 hypothetical protein [Lewinella sp. W8]
MRMRLISALFVLFFLSFLTPVSAQPGNPAQADTVSLRGQFDEMVRVSNRYQRFRVVRQDFLNAFMANVADTIGGLTEELALRQGKIDEQATAIGGLETDVQERDATIEQLNKEKDGISVFGLLLSKGTYNLIMWTLAIGLLAALLFALARTRVAVSTSKDRKGQIEKLTSELETSRKQRLKIEQDLRRQLQDEINKRNQA